MRLIALVFALTLAVTPAWSALSPITAPPEKPLPRQDASALARLSRSWSDSVDTAPNREAAKKAARQALDLAQEAVKTDPRNGQARLALAIACGKGTDFADSKTRLALSRQIRSEAEQAITLDPKLDLAYYTLGRWHLEIANVNPFVRFGARLTGGPLPSGSLDDAVRNLEKAAELSPRTIMYHQYLALAYQAQGRRADAAHQWRIVVDLPNVDRDDEAAKQQARAALAR